jgi:hypothetical protein
LKTKSMVRKFVILLLLTLGLIPRSVLSQNKSICFTASGGINRYFGLKGDYNYPSAEYRYGSAATAELSFISGKNYLPNQYAAGVVIDYFTGSFRQYGEGLNGGDYLNGEVSKLMIGGYLVPYIFEYNKELFIRPGIEWTYLVSAEVDGFILSKEVPTFGQKMELKEDFVSKSDLGLALTIEYVFHIKKRWHLAPRYKGYVSLQGTMPEMNTFRNTIGLSIGYRLRERLNDYNRLP